MKKKPFAYYPLKLLWISLSVIPLPVLYFFSDIWYYPFYYIVKYRKKTVRKNLQQSFPEKNKAEIIRIEKRFYHFFLDLVFETAKFGTISEKGIKKRMKYINMEEVNDDLQQGKSISLYLGHLGCWEWLSSMPLHLEKEAIPAQVYKKIANRATNDLLLENRRHFGAVNIEMKSVPRWIKEQIDNNRLTITGYIADQSPKKRDSHYFVDFFHQEVPVIVGAEKISKRYNMQVYYVDILRPKRGYYEAHFIKMDKSPQALEDYKLTEIFYKHLEATIRRNPSIYLWTHNRFKYKRNKNTDN